MIGWLYRVATGLILVGFAFLCQPFSMQVYAAGFPVLLAGTALHIVLDHVPRRAEPTIDADDNTGR